MRVVTLLQPVTRGACLAAVTVSVLAAQAPAPASPIAGAPSDTEVRALWVTRSTMATPAGVRRMVQTARDGGFNTLLVQVRGRGDAYYRSTLEPRAADLRSQPAFDPLADSIRLGREAGLRVHGWVGVNLVSSAVDLPSSPQHILRRHPEWLMVPRELAVELGPVNPRSAAYVTRLARWTRTRAAEVEGLYVSPIHPGAIDHMAAVVRDLLTAYDLDGIHLDYVRYPGDQFDYGRSALAAFERTIRPNMDESERRRLAMQSAQDPLIYTRRFPVQWTAFRRSRLTELVTRIRDTVRAVRPSTVLSAAVVPDAREALDRRLQDWPTWLDRSLLDLICPMAYSTDLAVFERQINEAQAAAGSATVWAGVGAYRLTSAATLAHIAAARRLGAAGVVLFSYDALVAPPNDPASLAELGRAAFGGASR
jgi:uncharacterized lipoprotein YddW (UPF0748 family)